MAFAYKSSTFYTSCTIAAASRSPSAVTGFRSNLQKRASCTNPMVPATASRSSDPPWPRHANHREGVSGHVIEMPSRLGQHEDIAAPAASYWLHGVQMRALILLLRRKCQLVQFRTGFSYQRNKLYDTRWFQRFALAMAHCSRAGSPPKLDANPGSSMACCAPRMPSLLTNLFELSVVLSVALLQSAMRQADATAQRNFFIASPPFPALSPPMRMRRGRDGMKTHATNVSW
jgi:hypothetical protein